MPTAKFIATLELADGAGHSAVITNLKPFKVAVQKAASSPDGDLPFHSGEPATEPDVWLQIWSMGENEPKKWRGPPSLKPPAGKNELCCEIPGYLAEVSGAYEFRALAAPKPGSGNPLGWMKLRMNDGSGKPWQKDGKDLHAQITADGVEDEVDVACTLQKAAGGSTAPAKAPIFSFTNLNHVIGSQLKEGGLTLGFYVDCPHADPRKPNSDFNFRAYGEWGARRAHALGIKNGELYIGASGFQKDEQDIIDAMKLVVQKVHAEFLEGAGDPPKVKRFFSCTHGDSNKSILGMKAGENCPWLVHPSDRLEKFLDQLAPMLMNDAVWAQCSCHCAAPRSASPNGDYCLQAKDPKVGEGSFSDECRKGLEKRGVAEVAVWGHTSAGDAIRNTQLRAFTKYGNMDLCYMVLGWPDKTKGNLAALRTPWAIFSGTGRPDQSKVIWRAFDASLKNPGEFIKGIYGAG